MTLGNVEVVFEVARIEEVVLKEPGTFIIRACTGGDLLGERSDRVGPTAVGGGLPGAARWGKCGVLGEELAIEAGGGIDGEGCGGVVGNPWSR